MQEKTKLPKGGCVVQRPKSKNGETPFQGQFKPIGSPSVSDTFSTREAAEAYVFRIAAKYEKENRQSRKPEKEGEVNLFEERLRLSCELFLESRECHSRHKAHMPGLLHLIGDPTIGQLKKSWIKNFIFKAREKKASKKCSKPYAFSTISGFLSLINIVLVFRADELDQISPSFVVDSKYFEAVARAEGGPWRDGAYFVKRTRRIEPEFDEEQRLMAHIVNSDALVQRQLRLLFRFALETCGRLKELVLATWDQISPARKTWSIPRYKTKERSMTLYDKGRAILDELSSMRKPGEKRLFYALKTPYWVSVEFQQFIKDAELLDFRFHDLRHEAITRLVATQSMPMDLLMAAVGHSSPRMTALYTHLRESELERMSVQAPAAAWWRAESPVAQPMGQTEIADGTLQPG